MALSAFGLGGGSSLSSHPHLHRLPPLHRWWVAGARNPRTTTAALVLVVCVAAPATYLALAKRSLGRRTEARPARVRSLRSGSAAEGDDGEEILTGTLVPLPDEEMAREADAGVVVARETVCSLPFPVASLKPEFVRRRSGPGLGLGLGADAGTGADAEVSEVDKDAMVSAFLRTSMRLFTRTPQALVMRRLMPPGEESFEAPYLDACGFAVGDRVCGVYVVAERRAADGVAVLRLSPPEGWSGPRPEGVIAVAVVEDRGGEEGKGARKLRFVNETVLWRRADAAPTVLEGRVGAWLHELMIRWFVVRAVAAVTV
ncbi:hypothetical protein DL766_001510 [Monosporascus sp. MC13-8B]|uniref:Uncharacterized protein n=1 Tax=Monosporascus cannonballus TaxID=155416 RepID=A0ABY0GVF8_9PEZI|nr:hypothetical protein DL762_008699 [Monosporascus cannonballus]RYO99847.1 hypothetical protein DL763_001237 [Monosporascus cannonballus]RYP37516.1 hypothetical protein DL766_001510 [Monosporascus sp. MC13-8B]